MAMLWAFDVEAVVARSLVSRWIRACGSVLECYDAIARGRAALAHGTRDIEELPSHTMYRNRHGKFM